MRSTLRFLIGIVLLSAMLLLAPPGRTWFLKNIAPYSGYVSRSFTPVAWATASPEERGHMADDLLQKHRLEGMQTEQVQALLGKPDRIDPTLGWIYHLGYRGRNPNSPLCMGCFQYWLRLEVNDQERVTKVLVVD